MIINKGERGRFLGLPLAFFSTNTIRMSYLLTEIPRPVFFSNLIKLSTKQLVFYAFKKQNKDHRMVETK